MYCMVLWSTLLMILEFTVYNISRSVACLNLAIQFGRQFEHGHPAFRQAQFSTGVCWVWAMSVDILSCKLLRSVDFHTTVLAQKQEWKKTS